MVTAEGHLVDSQVLKTIFDRIVERGASFEVQDFVLGRTNDDFSKLTLKISAPQPALLARLVEDLVPLGCRSVGEQDALVRIADRDGGRARGLLFHHQPAHAGAAPGAVGRRLAAADGCGHRRQPTRDRCAASCGTSGAGDRVVCGLDGLRVTPEFRDRERGDFTFMSNEVSSERRVEASVTKVAQMMRDTRARGKRIAFVAGPVVVHTGGVGYFGELIRKGYVDVILAGNALAVHDAEHTLFGTSLGVDLEMGTAVAGGHRHHMRAINIINRAGGIRAAVEAGVLTRGLMVDCVRGGVELLLAGSIRDDGPLVDTITDMVEAQDRYTAALADVGLVIVLSTMLHGIGVGNMLPAWVPVVCVDINPAVVTKLADRGSSQTMGLVTDVGLFLHQLAEQT